MQVYLKLQNVQFSLNMEIQKHILLLLNIFLMPHIIDCITWLKHSQ